MWTCRQAAGIGGEAELPRVELGRGDALGVDVGEGEGGVSGWTSKWGEVEHHGMEWLTAEEMARVICLMKWVVPPVPAHGGVR